MAPDDRSAASFESALSSVSAVEHRDLANAIRALAMDAVEAANSGHPGMPMGAADMATVLFGRFLKFDPMDPGWADRDRFVLSAGHGSMLLYALLHLTGYEDMTLEELKNFRQLGSITAGHPEYGHAAGIETTTGPLGQGIATAVGMALAERMMAARFGGDVVDHYTWVIAGDGDLMEGISHEAGSLAGHLRLSRLIVLYDDNNISIDGGTDLALSDDACARFDSYGWHTARVDGHDPDAIAAAVEDARKDGRPSLIACRTTIAYGAPTKAGTAAAHGAPLGKDEIAGARAALGWSYGAFEIPGAVLSAWREIGARGAAANAAWQGRVAKMDAAARAEFERTLAGRLPQGWQDAIDAAKRGFTVEAKTLATRQSSGAVLEGLTAAVPELAGGSADLTGSVNTRTRAHRPVRAQDFSGGYIHYGVREHGMAAAMNGMALHGGLIPYSGTFLIFSDYMRPAIRLAALMKQRVIHVATHDSIGLGEDGPTHQPVEQLASLRAMPNLNVFRPADAVEVAECWALALESEYTPSVMALTRQGLPLLRTTHTDENLCAKGGYVLAEADGERKVTLLATGSEVSIAMAARDALRADGIGAAVVSMPCWSRFDAQPADYRESVLKKNTVRIAVEAGVRLGWDRYIGPDGGFVGMTGFGASAPAAALYAHFGITAEAVAAEARMRLD
ncbi:MAG: transketolase [Alphaproteobacteria bacterium]|nr:transketolase [Alphaproteobacteria bacterium]